jgi:hypothetical protein
LKRFTILLALLLLVAAGCSSQTGSSAEASEAAATEEPTPTDEPSEEPDTSDVAIPSFDLNGDPELAGRFPETVGGQPLQVQSFRGDTFAQMGGSDPSFQAFLDSVGADLEDVSVAFGGVVPTEADPTGILSVGAFRVLGASEDDLEREFIAASEEAGDVTGLTEASVGGKDVWTASDPSGETALSVFIYTKDDTLYFLTGSEEQVAEILAALP